MSALISNPFEYLKQTYKTQEMLNIKYVDGIKINFSQGLFRHQFTRTESAIFPIAAAIYYEDFGESERLVYSLDEVSSAAIDLAQKVPDLTTLGLDRVETLLLWQGLRKNYECEDLKIRKYCAYSKSRVYRKIRAALIENKPVIFNCYYKDYYENFFVGGAMEVEIDTISGGIKDIVLLKIYDLKDFKVKYIDLNHISRKSVFFISEDK